ncbi:MAG: hypothetical protein AAB088_02150 [Actinomycetota bacterium]
MPISRFPKPAATFRKQALALTWGAWTQLGVAGLTTTHSDWAVDPEPLVLFTAWLGDSDPRLRDEATDWCVRNWRYLSRTRLKNLLRDQPDDVRLAFGEFAATAGKHSGVVWPSATEARNFKVTGRSVLAPLERPSMAWVRLRAMFGVSARSEILRYLLSQTGAASIARLAAVTSYTKRNVADECETLQRAGVLSVRSTGNRLYYSLANRLALEAFVGELPSNRPDWTSILRITRELVALEESAVDRSLQTLPVRVKKMLRLIEDDLAELGIERSFDNIEGANLWPAVRKLGMETLGAWSIGEYHEVPSIKVVRRLRPVAK